MQTEESPGMFISLDDVLYNEQYPNLSQLGNLTAINDKLEVICDIKGTLKISKKRKTEKDHYI